MKAYQWILFDADDTLFHFDAFRGLQLMLANYGVDFTADDYHEYQTLNHALWTEYQNGVIDAAELQEQRFSVWGNKLNITPLELNKQFLVAMAEICTPLPGANELLTMLQGKVSLGIVTNGFTELQEARLQQVGYRHHFDILVISEQVGAAKPHPAIFDHAHSLMGYPDREHVLMVGDNPDSDILGGMNAGFDTCWVNRHSKVLPENITPTYEVPSLTALQKLLAPYFSLEANSKR